jgi:hypothetical protein
MCDQDKDALRHKTMTDAIWRRPALMLDAHSQDAEDQHRHKIGK